MRRVIVIGLGTFGQSLVRKLGEARRDVVAIDKNKEAVQSVRDSASLAIVADGTDKDALDQIGIHEDDIVVISFGEDLAAATLITLNLKQRRVKAIIVKAPNEEYRMILERVGATEVIIPEKEMADRVVRGLTSPNIVDYLSLSEDFMISELAPPERFLGKTLAQLQLRAAYRINVIGVKDVLTEKLTMNPTADFVVKDGEVLIVVGKAKDIEKIK